MGDEVQETLCKCCLLRGTDSSVLIGIYKVLKDSLRSGSVIPVAAAFVLPNFFCCCCCKYPRICYFIGFLMPMLVEYPIYVSPGTKLGGKRAAMWVMAWSDILTLSFEVLDECVACIRWRFLCDYICLKARYVTEEFSCPDAAYPWSKTFLALSRLLSYKLDASWALVRLIDIL